MEFRERLEELERDVADLQAEVLCIKCVHYVGCPFSPDTCGKFEPLILDRQVNCEDCVHRSYERCSIAKQVNPKEHPFSNSKLYNINHDCKFHQAERRGKI